MPRYFFHVDNHEASARDETGKELADLEAARRYALRDIHSIVSEEVASGLLDLTGHIIITGELGNTVMKIAYPEAFEIRMPD